MSKFVRINRKSVVKNFTGVILVFISMLLQVYYFFGYVDQGALYELIKNGEFVIYTFNAAVYLYILWELCCNFKGTLGIVFSLMAPVAYIAHFSAYYVSLRFSITEDPKTKGEFFDLLIDAMKGDFAASCGKYIAVFVIMLALCLAVSVMKPDNIKHILHVAKMKLHNLITDSGYTLINLGSEFQIVKLFGDELILSKDGTELEYDIELEVRDWNDQSVYFVFTDNELNENNNFNYYVGKRDRKHGRLVPVEKQSVFDEIENLMQ